MHRQPFVLRMAGFPFAWLAELVDAETAAAAGRVTAQERELAARFREIPSDRARWVGRTGAGRAVLRAARTGRGDLSAARIEGIEDDTVRELVAAIAAGWAEHRRFTAEFQRRYDAALTRTRLDLCTRFVKEDSLRDMLFALNPGACGTIELKLDRVSGDPADWRAKDRVFLDPLTLYLQRACAKNDSTGHAGPFAVGTFDPGTDGLRWSEVPLRHHAFLSRWVGEAILRWYSATEDGAALLTPRRAPGVEVIGPDVDHLTIDNTQYADINRVVGQRTRHGGLPAADLDVLARCDGAHTVAQITAELGEDARASVVRLAGLGLIIAVLEVPYGVDDSLPLLETLAADSGSAPFRELVSACAETVRIQATASRPERAEALRRLEALFVRTTGESPERGTGGFYQDRALIYEETIGRVGSPVLGRELTERVRRALPLITDVFLFLPRLRQRLERDLLAEWFTARFPAGTASINDYLRAFADDEGLLAPAFDRVERDLHAWEDRLRAASGATEEGPERLRAFLAEHGPRLPAVCNIDLMLAAEPGATRLSEPTRLVVSEVHADEEQLTHGMFASFVAEHHPSVADEVLAAYRTLLADGEILMNATMRHTDKTFSRLHLDCPDIESADRSPLHPRLRRQLADLLVVCGPDGLRLVERGLGRTVRLIAVPLSWRRLPNNPLEIFGFPRRRGGTLFEVRPGECLREVALGDLVLSRRAWSVEAAEVKARNARDSFLAVRRLRERLGLPRHVFAGTAEEGKPIYVDLDSPLLVRQLTRFADRADHVRFTEMVPGPEELWLRTDGEVYTSELRFAAFDGRR